MWLFLFAENLSVQIDTRPGSAQLSSAEWCGGLPVAFDPAARAVCF